MRLDVEVDAPKSCVCPTGNPSIPLTLPLLLLLLLYYHVSIWLMGNSCSVKALHMPHPRAVPAAKSIGVYCAPQTLYSKNNKIL